MRHRLAEWQGRRISLKWDRGLSCTSTDLDWPDVHFIVMKNPRHESILAYANVQLSLAARNDRSRGLRPNIPVSSYPAGWQDGRVVELPYCSGKLAN